jgi:Uma2 family endonuclease
MEKVLTEPITSIDQLDPNGVYSYADYLTWKFEETVELIKGKIFRMAAPARRHQAISREMNGIFYIHFQKNPCEFYAAPFDVRLYNKRKSVKANKDIFTVVQPDICIICDLEKLDDKGCSGAPDLIVEILSPGNSKKEMVNKYALYEENGVREYWVISPESEMLTQFILQDNDKYAPPQYFFSDDVMNAHIFPELSIDLGKVLLQK